MIENIGNTDRIVRLIVAIAVSILYFTGILTGTLGIISVILSGVLVLSSLVGFCPLYIPFGINTCHDEK
ncbi:MAG: DUF2892 domain-containing protein [Cyclobacteriaceae bacterium]|nr:DUF2892 domain-containing protein [Cyclobacteriaceae bacterium]